MYVAIFFLLVGALYAAWDYKLSKASKILRQLHELEPEIYDSLHGNPKLFPSASINAIITNGSYLKIKSKSLKAEILAINSEQQRYVLWPIILFVGLILISLLLRALSGV
jgi:hypothetical protein